MRLRTRKFNNRKLSSILRTATKFYIQHLLPNYKHSLFKIDIIGVKNLEADGTFEKISTNRYAIELRTDLDIQIMLLTLAHELVHLKQYATNELRSRVVAGQLVDIWKGKRYRNLKYDDQPWEIEALQKEQDLFEDFISECYASGKLINKLVKLRGFTR